MPFSPLPALLSACLAQLADALDRRSAPRLLLLFCCVLPLRALLYVRAKDVPKLAQEYPWAFRTKLQLAVALVRWLTVYLAGTAKQVWLAADGAYAKAPFLKPVLRLGVVVVSRLRQDA